MIVETTHYYALPGRVDAVLEQRRRATDVRIKLGLLPGRILRKLEGAGPDIRWECSFETRADYDADMAVRAASAEFATARQAMHTLIERFERHLHEHVVD